MTITYRPKTTDRQTDWLRLISMVKPLTAYSSKYTSTLILHQYIAEMVAIGVSTSIHHIVLPVFISSLSLYKGLHKWCLPPSVIRGLIVYPYIVPHMVSICVLPSTYPRVWERKEGVGVMDVTFIHGADQAYLYIGQFVIIMIRLVLMCP